ncbi:MAG: hypothetical protein R3E95_03155 [Thiolinea sp.]
MLLAGGPGLAVNAPHGADTGYGFGVDEPIDIVKALGEHARRSLIPDTLTEHDMDKAIADGSRRIWVGARGLSAALARSMGINADKPAPLSGRIAMAVGSG